MKIGLFIFVFVFIFVAVFGQSIPTKKCPPGEHSVLYCPRMAEPSCNNPTLHRKFGACGIPDCFCDTPNVRDTNTNRCIPSSEC
ncbi:unnamed protein product, partial [Brenthis ino]